MIELGNLSTTQRMFSLLFPECDFKFGELDREEAEVSVLHLLDVIDALLKAENLYRKRNLILPAGYSFFPEDLTDQMKLINLYLNKFNTKVFGFTRTDRQTFTFIIENMMDYFARLDESPASGDSKDKKGQYADYKFWIENFFKVFDQKIKGSFTMGDGGLVFSNSNMDIPLEPFLLLQGEESYFLKGIKDGSLQYASPGGGELIFNNDPHLISRVFEFLVANFNFQMAGMINSAGLDSEYPWGSHLAEIEGGVSLHTEGRFEESHRILEKLDFEEINLPLLYLVQINNLVSLEKKFELKRMLQKFILFYPYYPNGYEIMGDLYWKEKNLEMAQNSYVKVLNLTQNKRVAERLKVLKEEIAKGKQKTDVSSGDAFYDISEAVLQANEEFLAREKEVRQMMEVLCSTSRGNLLIVGESGVGKTTLIQLLAQKIMEGEVPLELKDKRIKEIGFVGLLTGAKYRGQFEEKVLKVLTEFKSHNSILVLEDIHLMMSSGAPRGTSLDLVNILKQFLRDRSFPVIATTNYEELKNSVEKDNSLMGFFQKLSLNELSVDETASILKRRAEGVLERDNVIVPPEIIEDIIEGAKRNIREKRLPDSAILIFDRCVSKLKLKIHTGEALRFEAEPSDVIEVLSDMLNLPESSISVSMRKRLSGLKEAISHHIVGQTAAIDKVVANVVASKLNLDVKNNRPDGVFLFIGPTGVGKTETAIALAKALYGSEDYLIRIDMSEYMERFTYSRFIGAAPGYVGYYDANQLTDKVRQNPFSVILLDEFEKADIQLINIFLQVFDAGRLTDARGNVVDFSHTTIIMTSNIGTSLFSKSQMGYQSSFTSGAVSRGDLIKALKRHFSPEFLNRIDEIVIFDPLGEEDIRNIIEVQLRGIRAGLGKQGKELVVGDDVFRYIIDHYHSKEYGARNVSRALKTELLQKVAHLSLQDDWDEAKCVACGVREDSIEVRLVSECLGEAPDGRQVMARNKSEGYE